MDKMSGFSDVEERMNPTKAGPGAEGPLFLPPDVHAEGEWVRLWANFDHAQIFCPSRSGSKSDMLDRELRAEFGVIERRSGARRPDGGFDERIDHLLNQHGVDYVRGYGDALKDASQCHEIGAEHSTGEWTEA